MLKARKRPNLHSRELLQYFIIISCHNKLWFQFLAHLIPFNVFLCVCYLCFSLCVSQGAASGLKNEITAQCQKQVFWWPNVSQYLEMQNFRHEHHRFTVWTPLRSNRIKQGMLSCPSHSHFPLFHLRLFFPFFSLPPHLLTLTAFFHSLLYFLFSFSFPLKVLLGKELWLKRFLFVCTSEQTQV